MTMQDKSSFQLTDEELEAANGGAGQWVAPSKGQWWVWKEESSSFSGNSASFQGHSTSSSSTVRNAVIDGKTHFYKFDGTKEHLVGVR